MKSYLRGFAVVGIGGLLLAVCLSTLSASAVTLAAPLAQDDDALPSGGFTLDGPSVNVTGQSAQMPALAIRLGADTPLAAFAQNDRILVSQYVTAANQWAQQDGALNRSLANSARQPTLDFGGANRNTPWVAWSEGSGQINASWYNGSNWVLTPILNRNPAHEAAQPALVAGATVSGAIPLPWVAWAEATSDFVEIAVSRAVADGGAQGGYRWQPVGQTIQFAAAHDATNPDLAFAGVGNSTPWIVWQESGGGQPGLIFARRFVANAWRNVGRQENCGNDANACALNLDPQRGASLPRITSGRLANETSTTPWIVFAEQNPDAGSAIRVMRLDPGAPGDPADDRFVPVGGAVNRQCLGRSGLNGQGGDEPAIAFVGSVPHVAWVEIQQGLRQLFVCHLADARPGQERWDLDSITPLNRMMAVIGRPSLAANGLTPYVSWQEGTDPADVFVAHRTPAGPAWGSSQPAYVRVVSPRPEPIDKASTLAAALAALHTPTVQSNPVTITTVANHVNGWEQIDEVQFRLSNAGETALLARYVVAENKVYVQDPDSPGVFFPGITPGAGSPSIPTRYVTVLAAAMSVASFGDSSPALDIHWVLRFEDDAFLKRYAQSINIVYADAPAQRALAVVTGEPVRAGQAGTESTGFFQVGEVFVGQESFLPIVAK